MTTRPESARACSAAAMAVTTVGDGFEGLLLADLYVDDDLGEGLEVGGEFGQGFT